MRISDWSSDVCSSDLWCGGAALMALPFYIVQADALGLGLKDAAILLAAQTTGALMSNLPWGWWGDKWGKVSLLRAIAFGRMTPPIVILVLSSVALDKDKVLAAFVSVFVVLGSLAHCIPLALIGDRKRIGTGKS